MRTVWMLILGASLALATAVWAQSGAKAVDQGKDLFFSQGCYGCHRIGKAGTPIAWDLSTIGRKYTEDQLTQWLRGPSAQKPGAHMPRLALVDEEIRALAAYLATLR